MFEFLKIILGVSVGIGVALATYFFVRKMQKTINFDMGNQRLLEILPIQKCDAVIIEKNMNFQGVGHFIYPQQFVTIELSDHTRMVLRPPTNLYNIIIDGDTGTVFYKEYKGQFYLVDFQRKTNKPTE